MTSDHDIEKRAATWLLRMEEPDWSAVEQAEFDVWLNESSLHRVAFYRLEYGWRRADRIAALKTPPPPTQARRYLVISPWQQAVLAIFVFAVMIGAGVWLQFERAVPPKTYVTEIGGRSILPLFDGTRVELNTNSLLRVLITKKSRAVWLDRGEAYFEVAHDPNRPFSIHVNGRLITVLGTKFSIRNKEEGLVVAVVEGKVQVDATPAPRVIATAGDIVTTQGTGILVDRGATDRLTRLLSWRQGFVTFDRATLMEVAREFNRYNRKQIVVAPAAEDAVHIGGRFDPENVEAFARLLQSAYHLDVRDEGGVIKISGKKEKR